MLCFSISVRCPIPTDWVAKRRKNQRKVAGSISDNWYYVHVYYKPIGNVSTTLKTKIGHSTPKWNDLKLWHFKGFTDPYTNLTHRSMMGGGRFNFYKIVIEMIVTPVSTVNVF